MLHTTDVAVALGMLIVFGGAVLLLLRHLWRQAPLAPRKVPPNALFQGEDEGPRCQTLCAELATEPAPRLERGRGSVLRDLFALPPTYRRVIDRSGPPVYCKSHAHLADSKAAEFLAAERAVLARAYAQVAHRAATFEQEELPRMMRESLTEQQKKDARRPSPVTPIRRADEG